MRFQEFSGGIQVPVSNDDIKILDKITETPNTIIDMNDLSESEIELARKMVSRGVLSRHQIDGSTYYSIKYAFRSDK